MNNTTIAAKLTSRQIALLRLVAQGFINEQIGKQLGYTKRTAEQYVHGLQQFLGLSNRAQLVIYAFKAGIIDLDEITLPAKTGSNF